ncbi:hypothetical protein ACLHWY_17630 [Priestia aryabhattai]|uniref:hypothetical protein n=1 Tax=Priestia aryabhattai TaxID=412384 RepID=UPI003983228A
MKDFEYIKPEFRRKFIGEYALTSPEAMELLKISRPKLSWMIRGCKIKPVKKFVSISLVLKNDLVEKKKQLGFSEQHTVHISK